MASCMANLADVLLARGGAAEARTMLEAALRLLEGQFGAEHVQSAQVLIQLAKAHGACGNYKGMKPLLERALRIQEKAFGPDHLNLVSTYRNLGGVLQQLGEGGRARALVERAYKIQEKQLGKHSDGGSAWMIAFTMLNNLAAAHEMLGDRKETLSLISQALEINRAYFGENHPNVAINIKNLAGQFGYQGNVGKMMELHMSALRIFQRLLGHGHPTSWDCVADIAIDKLILRSNLEAVTLFSQAITAFSNIGLLSNIIILFFCQCIAEEQAKSQLQGQAATRKGTAASRLRQSFERTKHLKESMIADNCNLNVVEMTTILMNLAEMCQACGRADLQESFTAAAEYLVSVLEGITHKLALKATANIENGEGRNEKADEVKDARTTSSNRKAAITAADLGPLSRQIQRSKLVIEQWKSKQKTSIAAGSDETQQQQQGLQHSVKERKQSLAVFPSRELALVSIGALGAGAFVALAAGIWYLLGGGSSAQQRGHRPQ
eukprot:jgi/Bigna1/49222/estExt_Genewise1.C_430018